MPRNFTLDVNGGLAMPPKLKFFEINGYILGERTYPVPTRVDCIGVDPGKWV